MKELNVIMKTVFPDGLVITKGVLLLQVHLGRGVYIPKTSLENVEATATSNAVFVKNLAVALWGLERLGASSVFGKSCPAKKNEPAKPPLTPEKINAITGNSQCDQ
jgi:hypothetical protein